MNPATLFGDTPDEKFNNWRHTPEASAYISRFVQLAVEYRNRGRHKSAKQLVEELRDEGLGINNLLTSRLSRYVMASYPEQLGEYFTVRSLTAHRKAA